MFEQFFEGTTQAIYETGQGSPIDNADLKQSGKYDVREFVNNQMLRCQTGIQGSELMDYLGIKPVAKVSKKIEPVEVVKEKSTLSKLIKGKKK